MRLRLEFIRRRPIPWLALFCMGCALGWGTMLLAESIALRKVALRDRQRVAQLEQRLHERRQAAQKQLAKSDPETQRRQKEQEKIIAALRYPWTRVFSTIEQADSNEVAIIALSHEQATGQTQIMLDALDTHGLVHFVDALNEGGEGSARGQWYLTTYQIQLQSSPQTMRGTVLNK
ncbi:hypothetical protein [Janthinobacterium sp. 1_2014MBL_MicDiv]|uniref:hypothetical protein n=1 Tax=Janthinobacterium sp. 1_2014MBL_MicDiv TaxID=1644131 RepID=UPI0008F4D4A4|nr:hypothetical protein [Janthinobacterium sp. 1_2014MBL_MicDiv]APA68762.1 hypothetical protein YQ44_14190 [Janthinobacterium sp. 1_2014MBL_MicDiv]